MRNGEINKNDKQIHVGHLSYPSTLKFYYLSNKWKNSSYYQHFSVEKDDRHKIYILKKGTYKKYRHSIICIIKTSFTQYIAQENWNFYVQ